MDTFALLLQSINYLAAVELGHDPAGGINNIMVGRGLDLTFTGMIVVFIGLIILTFVMVYLQSGINAVKSLAESAINIGKKKPKDEIAASEGAEAVKSTKSVEEMTGEEVAAVCTAIILYHRMHMGDRQEIITAKSQLKMLSPWALAGKIHPSKRLR